MSKYQDLILCMMKDTAITTGNENFSSVSNNADDYTVNLATYADDSNFYDNLMHLYGKYLKVVYTSEKIKTFDQGYILRVLCLSDSVTPKDFKKLKALFKLRGLLC